MEIRDKTLIVRTRHPQKYGVIPKIKHLPMENDLYPIEVPWGLEEARVLKNLGVKKVPSPILREYNWPGRFKPFEHQKDTASFFTLNRRAFCFNEPGTGKTMAALWAADYLMNRGEVRRCLVVSPLSIMQVAWLQDLNRSIVHRTAAIAYSTNADKRRTVIKNGYEFVITNYEGIAIIADEVRKDGGFDLIIVDEANAYKNVSTKRWKTLNALLTPNTYLWMMTGTPAAQSPEDAFGLARLVNPGGVPRFAGAWRDKVMRKVSMFKWVPKENAKDEVYRALQPAIRYTKAECLDLPPVLTETREVELTPQQRKYYNFLKSQMLLNVAGETITAVNAAASVNKLLQISAGAAYSDRKEVVEFDCTPRLNVLTEVLEETPRKVLVFALFRHTIDTIAAHLKKLGIPHGVIHGDVPASKRSVLFNKFQNTDDPHVLIIQPQAAAHGVTLTAADTVVFWGPVMSVETYIQCIARSDRQGQTSDKVTVVHIEGSDIERRMFTLLEGRVKDHNAIVKLYEDELTGKKP